MCDDLEVSGRQNAQFPEGLDMATLASLTANAMEKRTISRKLLQIPISLISFNLHISSDQSSSSDYKLALSA